MYTVSDLPLSALIDKKNNINLSYFPICHSIEFL